jgi:hypothetical protein
MSEKDNIAYSEISKRIDRTEEEILIVRERVHDLKGNQGYIMAAVEKIDDSLIRVFENQNNLQEKNLEVQKQHAEKFAEIEKITKKIEIVSSHWKTICALIIIPLIIGFCAENGAKDTVKVIARLIAPDKVIKAAETINNG